MLIKLEKKRLSGVVSLKVMFDRLSVLIQQFFFFRSTVMGNM